MNEHSPRGGGSLKLHDVVPSESLAYLERVEEAISGLEPKEIATRIVELSSEHDEWRLRCINMLASELGMGQGALQLLATDLATRVTEGFPGAKIFPPNVVNRYVDELEGILIALCKKLFHARFIEWRPTSNSMANALVLFALTEPGDAILVQSTEGGGNMSYQEASIPDLRPLRVFEIPPAGNWEIDIDVLRETARRVRPRLIVVGGSKFLFPFPLSEIRQVADEVEAKVLYDAAHVGPLISANLFQDPLAEGADVLTSGTHKMWGGPVGGVVATNDEDIAARVMKLTHPSFMQTRDQNKYAAAAFNFAGMLEWGADFASECVANARHFGWALEEEGIEVLGREREFTMTHQVFLDVSQWDSAEGQRRSLASNILLHRTRLPRDGLTDNVSGFRTSVQELTRRGLGKDGMRAVAKFVRRAVVDHDPPDEVAADVEDFLRAFPKFGYSY